MKSDNQIIIDAFFAMIDRLDKKGLPIEYIAFVLFQVCGDIVMDYLPKDKFEELIDEIMCDYS